MKHGVTRPDEDDKYNILYEGHSSHEPKSLSKEFINCLNHFQHVQIIYSGLSDDIISVLPPVSHDALLAI